MSRPTSPIRLTDFQTQVALGTLLGDSSLSRPRNGLNYHLSCYHAIAQREWLTQKYDWLSPASRPIQWCAYTDKRDGKIRKGGRFHTVSIPCFTRLESLLYRNRVKVITPEYLALISHPVALACLLSDDGSWDKAGIQIASKQFTLDENRLLADSLGKIFGLKITVLNYGKYPHVRITAASVQRTRDLVSPFTTPALAYKLGPTDYATRLVGRVEKACPVCHVPFLSYASDDKTFCSRQCAYKGRRSRWA